MKLLSKLSQKIYDRLEQKGRIDIVISKETAERLFVNEDADKQIRNKGRALIETMILIVFATTVICVILLLAGKRVLGEDNTVLRAPAGEGDKSYDLELSVANGERGNVMVTVTEQEVSAEQTVSIFDAAEEVLFREIKGENASLDQIRDSLNLIDKIEGMKVTVTWEADKEGFFSKNGRLRIIPTEAYSVTLYATLHYFDRIRRIPVFVTIVPPGETDPGKEDERTKRIEEAIRTADGKNPEDEKVTLPEEAGGEEFEWSEPADKRPLWQLFLGFAAAAMVIPRTRSSLKNEEKKRREQMERDYPEIISKLILLLTAGMTCSGAWKRICNDYLMAKQRIGKRYAYEEMLCSLRELEFGKSEASVYESFGNRTGILCYKRLSALLSRNLRRGSREILSLLDFEAREAYEARFEAVRKKGEETSTKLLLPMMGMLVIVIAIIVVPAFMGIGF